MPLLFKFLHRPGKNRTFGTAAFKNKIKVHVHLLISPETSLEGLAVYLKESFRGNLRTVKDGPVATRFNQDSAS
jgi:hypothetical protein